MPDQATITTGQSIADAIETFCRTREDMVYAWYRGDIDRRTDPKRQLAASIDEVVKELCAKPPLPIN